MENAEKIEALQKRITELESCLTETIVQNEFQISLLDSIPLLVCRFLPDGTIKYANQAYCAYFLEYWDNPVGKNLFSLVPKEDLASFKSRLGSLRYDAEAQPYEICFHTKSRGFRWLRWRDFVIRNRNGEPEHFSIGEDITEQKQSEISIRESEHRYRSLFSQMQSGLLLCEIIENETGGIGDLRILDTNPSFEIMTEIHRNELVGKRASEIFPVTLSNSIETLNKHAAAGTPMTFEHFSEETLKTFNVTVFYPEFGRIAVSIIDISARKKAEKDLKQSEEMYRTLVEVAPDGIAVMEMTGSIALNNKMMEELFGIEQGKGLRGRHISEFVPESEMKRFVANLELTRSIGQTDSIEYRLLRDDGTEFPAEMSAAIISDENSRHIGFYGIFRDISRRKASQQALLESEQRLTQIIDFLPDPAFGIDLDGKVIFWNRAIQELSGLKAEKAIGKTFEDYSLSIYSNTRPLLADMILVPENPAIKMLYPSYKKEGDILQSETFATKAGPEGAFVWAKAGPLYDADGNKIGAIESFRDITENKKMEAEIKKSEKKFREIFDSSPIAISLYDSSGSLETANRAYLYMFGITDSSTLRNYNLFKDPNLSRETKTKLLEGAPFSLRVKYDISISAENNLFKTYKTEPMELESIFTPLADVAAQSVRGWLVQNIDVTKITRLAEDLSALSQRLTSSQETERNRLSHELHDGLGMMLAALRMDIGWMKKKTRSATLKHKLDELSSSTLVAAGELSRICKGLRPIAIDSFGLSHAVLELPKEFKTRSQASFSIESEIEEIPLDRISKETAVNIYRILQEGLTNITKHSGADRVTVKLFTHGSDVILQIRDNGRGIDEKKEARSGLGILGMKERAAYCGGTARITSSSDDGVLIEVIMPAAPSNNKHIHTI